MILSNRMLTALAASLTLALAVHQTALAQTPSAADVGDADSFGHTVVYLGFRQSIPVTVAPTCAVTDPAVERCVPINTGGPTTFNESNLGVIRLPARSTRTLICQALTVFYSRDHLNSTGSPGQAEFTESAQLIVESPVLNDPTLINAVTGLPFNGSINFGLINIAENHGIGAGVFEHEQASNTKMCGAGLVSRQQLIQLFGLSPALATQFFQRPITIRMGLSGRARLTTGVSFFYLLRLFGDQ